MRRFEQPPFGSAGPVVAVTRWSGRRVTLDHRDPVDRFLAATARALDLTLVTADARLIAGSGFEVLANR